MCKTIFLFTIICIALTANADLYAQENEWTPINNGLDNLQVYTIVGHPENPDILYAGAEDGFYRSEDRGDNWECPLGELPVRSIWISSNGRAILIARSGGSFSDGIWISRNGGDNFEVLHWFVWPSAIAVDPDNNDHIFCGTLENGFIYTLDGGGNWQQANDGLPDVAIYHLGVKNLEDETYLFATTEDGLFRCVIGDDIEWEDIGLFCTGQMAFSFEDERGVFAGTGDESESDGLYYSDNLGDDWDWPPLIWAYYVQAVETMPNLVVMASTEIGVMRSIDDGENWTAMNEELDDFDITDLLVQVFEDEIIFYCATDGSGIFSYVLPIQEQGEWTPINNGLNDLQVYTIVDHPEDPDILYAGAQDGFYRSDNRGERWQNTSWIPAHSIWISLDGRTILATFGEGTRSDGIYISRNGGDDFEVFCWFGLASSIAVDPQNPQHIFCGSSRGDLIYSPDGGDNWQQANDGLPDGAIYHLGVKNLEENAYLFASTEDGLFRCLVDDNIEWEDISPQNLPAHQTAFSFEDERGVYVGIGAGSNSDALYYSGDLGDEWEMLGGGEVQAVETMPELVVMASTEFGINRSTDDGENWTEMNEELDDFDISDLLVQIEDGETRFYCTTNGSGIFVYTISLQEEDNPPSPFLLLEPENGDTLDSRLITFRWEESEDPDPEDEVTYDWWIGSGPEPLFVTDLDATELMVNLDTLDVDLPVSEWITWWVIAVSDTLSTECNERFTFLLELVSVKEDHGVSVTDFSLYPVYPNPFNSTAKITYNLPYGSYVSLSLFDLSGREAKTVARCHLPSGTHTTILNSDNLVTGMYFIQLAASGKTLIRSVILIR